MKVKEWLLEREKALLNDMRQIRGAGHVHYHDYYEVLWVYMYVKTNCTFQTGHYQLYLNKVLQNS